MAITLETTGLPAMQTPIMLIQMQLFPRARYRRFMSAVMGPKINVAFSDVPHYVGTRASDISDFKDNPGTPLDEVGVMPPSTAGAMHGISDGLGPSDDRQLHYS